MASVKPPAPRAVFLHLAAAFMLDPPVGSLKAAPNPTIYESLHPENAWPWL